jgi:hypothetical protein
MRIIIHCQSAIWIKIHSIEKVVGICEAQPENGERAMVGAAIIFIIGIGMILNGYSIEGRAESAMHQIYGGLYFVGGLIMIGLALSAAVMSAGLRSIRLAVEKGRPLPVAAPAGDSSPVIRMSLEPKRDAPTSSSYVQCPECGRENRVDARVCQCGHRLG